MKKTAIILTLLLLFANQHIARSKNLPPDQVWNAAAQPAARPFSALTHTTQSDWMSGERDHLDVRTLDALGTPYGWDNDPRGSIRLRSRPGEWTEYAHNPVLEPGETGEWDDAVISEAKVILVDNTFHMWYAGRWRHPEGLKTPMDIGYATSTDGVHWEKYYANPVLKRGPLGGYDENIISAPMPLYDGHTFYLWFSAVDFRGNWSINCATSTDGVKWPKSDANPLLTETHDQRWDAVYLAEPYVLFNGDHFQMWYNGASAQTNTLLGYAVSPDGLTWTRRQENRPVLNVAAGGAWDDFAVARASVLYDGERYQMWYEGHSGSAWRIGYATSPDGVEWTRGHDNPIVELGAEGSWKSRVASEPNVIFDGQLYRLYHSGYDGDKYRVGLVTAPPIYDKQGILVSPVISHSEPVPWGALTVDLSLPAQGSVAFAISTSDDGATWGEWRDAGVLTATAPFSGVRSLDLYALAVPASRFLRYRATLTTADPAFSPLIRQIVVAEAAPDFALTLDRRAVSLLPGRRVEVEVALQAQQGFDSSVHLSIVGLPGTLSATWSPGFITPPGAATLNLEAVDGALPGTIPLTLTATSGDLTHEVVLSLTILEPPPAPTATPTPLPTATLTPLPTRGPTPTPAPPPAPPEQSGTPFGAGATVAAAGVAALLAWGATLILVRPSQAKGKQTRRRWWRHWGWSILIALVILSGVYLIVRRQGERRRAEADYQTVLDGWPSGANAPAPWLSEVQIREAVEARTVAPYLRTLAVTCLDQAAALDIADLGFESNAGEIVAWAVAANESNAGQERLAAFLRGDPVDAPVFGYTIDDKELRSFVQNIAKQVEKPLVEHNLDLKAMTISAGHAGVSLDVEKAMALLKTAIDDPAINAVELPVVIAEPQPLGETGVARTLSAILPDWTQAPRPPAIEQVVIPFDAARWIGGEAQAADWTPTRPMTGYQFSPGQMGWTLDITAAQQIIQSAIDAGAQETSFKVIVDVAPPPLTLADIKPALLELAGHFDGLTGFYVQDLGSGEEIRHYTYITTSGMSMIKVAVMATAYRTLPQPFPAGLQDAMAQMIAHSINEKSNYVILQIGEGDFQAGLARINETLAALGMHQTYIRSAYRTENGPFYDPIDVPERPGVEIPPDERIDLWPDTAMQTSLADQATLFEALYRGAQGGGKLLAAFPKLTAQDCQAMLDLLKTNPTRTFLGPGFGDDVPMAHKNGFGGGSYTDERMNVGIVWPPDGRPYLVGLYQWDKIGWIHWLRVWPQQIEFSTTLYNYFTMPEPLPASNKPE